MPTNSNDELNLLSPSVDVDDSQESGDIIDDSLSQSTNPETGLDSPSEVI
jgi:hypothetical protein